MTDELNGLGDVRPCASYTLRVNGFERPVNDAWIGESLLYVLRERLGLAGAKDGCEQGECGACTVQVDGQLVAGCLVPAALAADSEIATVEGLSGAGTASDVQQALAESGAVQCGYCTPGLAMAVHDLLQRNHRPTDVEARQALCGNLCRCTGYRGVLAAVQTVAQAREAELEADLAAAEAAAEQAGPAAATAPADGDTAGTPAPAAGQQSAADLPLAGELPLYADSELWVEADQYAAAHRPPAAEQPPAQAPDGGYDTGYYQPPQPAEGYLGYVPAPAQAPGYEAAPYDTGLYEATPAHGIAHDGPAHDSTPAHGTPYIPTPAHGTSYETAPYGATPPHGTPLPEQAHYDGAPVYEGGYDTGQVYVGPVGYDSPVYEPAAGYDTAAGHGHPGHAGPAGYDGTTPAHGIRLPEDENA
ncbi:2Fe-2S iron-sulfur cluster-binding protein [Kitasatospora sp. DSM 101779]|uniref:(2Fe-2S)-binding protein n=1 Tax=Kitasatospora sp. DSM 101779 TaxID=2853165 RepID=UPI003985B620